ncbi:MAG: hypothetical protein PHC66_02870 [Candidatus Nanoarchaeia archaeon]|nr:hypothetical protein [Candidatus Nanoarchaeia archaeon]MDD5239005.1 hypothetical protein [Candidatus Nanoarchaeia archaeon]
MAFKKPAGKREVFEELFRPVNEFSEIEEEVKRVYASNFNRRFPENYSISIIDERQFAKLDAECSKIKIGLGDFDMIVPRGTPELVQTISDRGQIYENGYLLKGISKLFAISLAFHAIGHMETGLATFGAKDRLKSEIFAYVCQDEITGEYLIMNGLCGFNAGFMENAWYSTDEYHKKAWEFAKKFQTVPWSLEKIKEHILLEDSFREQ